MQKEFPLDKNDRGAYPKSYIMPETKDKFKAGDCVLLVREGKQNYIGEIIDFKVRKGKTDADEVRVKRYYFPKETRYGGYHYIGKKEVFESTQIGCEPVQNILSKCIIHSLKGFCDLGGNHGDEDYYCRFHYIPSDDKIIPAEEDHESKWVSVYCTCQRLFNPDREYVHCEECKDWLHPECVGRPFEELRAIEFYICESCQTKKREEPNKEKKKI